MKKKSGVFYEILLALVIVALILLPQLVGTTTVTDDSAGVDEKGCPVTSMTLENLEAPGTRFGTMTVLEWEKYNQGAFSAGRTQAL